MSFREAGAHLICGREGDAVFIIRRRRSLLAFDTCRIVHTPTTLDFPISDA